MTLLAAHGHIDRYWGGSSPYDDLTTKNLQQLTVKNAIADFTNFAKTVSLPFDSTNSSQAETAVSYNIHLVYYSMLTG